jgi:hypothetical protein
MTQLPSPLDVPDPSSADQAAPLPDLGSRLDNRRPGAVDPPPTIGVDPGQTWTAAVLRIGDRAVHGWTLGPADANGTVLRAALNDPDAWDAFRAYVGRLVPALDQLADWSIRHYGRVRLAVEVPRVPRGFIAGQRQKPIPLRDWVIPRQVAAAVLGAYPTARTVTPDGMGRRPASEYPPELRGTRPPEWGPCEARRGERDHERAAYDVAGRGAQL